MQNVNTRGHSEQGAALILAIISLMIITGLATAMLTSGRTESLIARNEERATHARMAAEAGLNHGVQVVADKLVNWQSDGFATAELAATNLLNGPDNVAGNTDDGSLTELGLPAPTATVTLSASTGTSYSVRVYDDDNTIAVRKITLSTADITRIEENNVVTSDANKRVVVHAIGTGPGGTVTSLEAIVGPLILPAVITNGNLTIEGSAEIVGTNGSVHSNGNLTINGGSSDITEDCTSSGTFSGDATNCGGAAGGGRQTITIPNVNAADYLVQATYVLHDDGRMQRVSDGVILCNTSADPDACNDAGYGWFFTSPTWSFGSDEPLDGAYYVEGNVVVSGSPGSSGMPVQITMIAEGYIDISGSPDFQPFLPETFLVTNQDLQITGSLSTPVSVEGQILVREQIKIAGNAELAGQVIVQDATTTCTLVTANNISGSVIITYNGMVGSNNFEVLAWKEVR
jgi:Tfp pilus assembly protein PilX/cytoskeletal protein CcmA (bactofilin family)